MRACYHKATPLAIKSQRLANGESMYLRFCLNKKVMYTWDLRRLKTSRTQTSDRIICKQITLFYDTFKLFQTIEATKLKIISTFQNILRFFIFHVSNALWLFSDKKTIITKIKIITFRYCTYNLIVLYLHQNNNTLYIKNQ